MAKLKLGNGRVVQGVWVPIELWEADIPPLAKLLLIEIHSYSCNGKEIPMSNDDLSKYLGVTERWARQLISLLQERHLITTRFDGKTRWVKSSLDYTNALSDLLQGGSTVPPRVEVQFHPDPQTGTTVPPCMELQFHPEQNRDHNLPPHTPPTNTPTTSHYTSLTSTASSEEKENNIKEKEDAKEKFRELCSEALKGKIWSESIAMKFHITDWRKTFNDFWMHITTQGKVDKLTDMTVKDFQAWFNNAAAHFIKSSTPQLGIGEEIDNGKRYYRYLGNSYECPMDVPPRPGMNYKWSIVSGNWYVPITY